MRPTMPSAGAARGGGLVRGSGTARGAGVLAVARYLFLDRRTYVLMPLSWSVLTFGLDVMVLELTPAGHGDKRWVWGLAAVYVIVFAIGAQAVARVLPFGLTLGFSRRTYFLGAVSLASAFAVCFGALVALGQAVERASDGWGIKMAYFRVAHLLDGAWWQTWLTAAVGFLLLFACGMWYGLVYRRGGLTGTWAFAGSQFLGLALLAAVITWTHGWGPIGRFLSAATAVDLTGILAGVAAVLLGGAYLTVRRLPV